MVGGDDGSGTGWFIDEQTVVTNNHVLTGADRAEEIYGWTVDGEKMQLDFVDRTGTQNPDVGVLQTDHEGTPVSTGDSSSLAGGDKLVAVGHPGSVGNWVVSLGMYLWREGKFGRSDYENMTSTVPGLQGVSGSSVVTMDGTSRG